MIRYFNTVRKHLVPKAGNTHVIQQVSQAGHTQAELTNKHQVIQAGNTQVIKQASQAGHAHVNQSNKVLSHKKWYRRE